jgi:malonate-semialdehyde dehydrogenase (acetylating) / methylmalonate-semialdehyde dehydrogenase
MRFADKFLRGPLISPAAKERVSGLIASANEDDGKILLDGRGLQVPGYPNGNFVGPTLIEAGTHMRCYKYVVLSS